MRNQQAKKLVIFENRRDQIRLNTKRFELTHVTITQTRFINVIDSRYPTRLILFYIAFGKTRVFNLGLQRLRPTWNNGFGDDTSVPFGIEAVNDDAVSSNCFAHLFHRCFDHIFFVK